MIYDPHKLGMDRIFEDQRIAQAERARDAANQRQADRANRKAASIDQAARKAAKHKGANGRIDGTTSDDDLDVIETIVGGLIVLAVLVGISYYGITEMPQLGLWSVGIGFVAAGVVRWLLVGPLKIILVSIKWLFILGIIGGILYAILESQAVPN